MPGHTDCMQKEPSHVARTLAGALRWIADELDDSRARDEHILQELGKLQRGMGEVLQAVSNLSQDYQTLRSDRDGPRQDAE